MRRGSVGDAAEVMAAEVMEGAERVEAARVAAVREVLRAAEVREEWRW